VVQIDATALKALTKKERQDETQLITKIDGFLSSNQLNANLIFFWSQSERALTSAPSTA
jgi:hypothetical protein